MKTLIITLVLAIGIMACEKPTETVCENLLAQQTGAGTNSLEGTKWRFEYFASTKDGKKIKKEKDITIDARWISFDQGTIQGALCNGIGGSYETREQNQLTISSVNTHTKLLCKSEVEDLVEQALEALRKSECYVIRDNELMIYYTAKDKANVLVLSKY